MEVAAVTALLGPKSAFKYSLQDPMESAPG